MEFITSVISHVQDKYADEPEAPDQRGRGADEEGRQALRDRLLQKQGGKERASHMLRKCFILAITLCLASGTGVATRHREGLGRGAAVSLRVCQRVQGPGRQEGRSTEGLWHRRPDRDMQGDPR